MVTPNRNEIIQRAREMYVQDCYRNGTPESADTNPTERELIENGFFQCARSQLMSDRYRHEIEARDYSVQNGNSFDIDIEELFQSNCLILGSRHSGKSDLAMMIAERAQDQGAIVVVVDPSQDWIKRSSIKRYTKTFSEVPSESRIYDVSLLSPSQQQSRIEQFSKQLFEYQAQKQNRKQYLVIMEESHVYFPQGALRSKKCQNSVRLLSVGRNVSISCMLVSQFASMIDKFCVKHGLSQAYFGFTREPNDLKYLRQILGDEVKELTKLEDGEFLYLSRNGLSRISIDPYQSYVQKGEIKPEIEPITVQSKNTNNLKTIMFLINSAICTFIVIWGIIFQ